MTKTNPLQSDETKLAEDRKEKAEVLNRQFQLEFTENDRNEIYEMDGPDQINNLTINVK